MLDHDTEECTKNYEGREIRELIYKLGKIILKRKRAPRPARLGYDAIES